ERRSAKVDFAGTLTGQNGNLWMVSKVPVQISSQTDLGGQTVAIGAAIRVRGFTQADGTVLAEHIELLPAGMPLPDFDEDDLTAPAHGTPESRIEPGEAGSGAESEDQSPTARETQSSDDDSASGKSSLNGTVDSLSGNTLTVNGQSLNMSGAEISGTPQVGASAKVEGYYDANGVFIVTKIEFQPVSSDGVGDSNNSGSKDGTSDSHNDSNSGSDDHGGGGGGSDSSAGGGGND
ncbi:MAG: DUF5666 domain-containing protein, partial [Bacteroidota bacterium]